MKLHQTLLALAFLSATTAFAGDPYAGEGPEMELTWANFALTLISPSFIVVIDACLAARNHPHNVGGIFTLAPWALGLGIVILYFAAR
jgi:hypothetical protein